MQTLTKSNKSNQMALTAMVKMPENFGRFTETLGDKDKAYQFLASLTSAVNGNEKLQKCDPMAIMGCAMIAASLNLDVNPNLGFASIVPYKDKADNQIPQFQMGWKGYVQLAQRTGQYKTMNVTEVYADEFDGFDPFKGELKYHMVSDGDRDNGRTDKVVGYAFYFEMISGYSKMAYMSKESAQAHAKRYSRAYQYDLTNRTKLSPWSTMFDAMAMKTLVKLTLSKWGILSTQMIMANKADQGTVTNYDGKDANPDITYGDNPIEEQNDINEKNKPEEPVKEPVKEEPNTEDLIEF